MPEQHTHEFDCRICGEHLHSQQELDRHNRDEHSQVAGGAGSNSSPGSTSYGSSRNGRGSLDEG